MQRCLRGLSALIVGLLLLSLAMSSLALAAPKTVVISPTLTPPLYTVPLTYARVITKNDTPVYSSPNRLTFSPTRIINKGYLWVSLVSTTPITADGQAWYQINQDEYVPMENITPYTPSLFHGITFTTQPTRPMGWMVYYTHPSITPGIIVTNTPWLRRYDLVTISDTAYITTTPWYQVGEHQWVHEHNVGLIKPITRPNEIGPLEKWVEVNLHEQTLLVHEGDNLIYATLVSSGLPLWKTPTGIYRIWSKVKSGKMSGGEVGNDYYFLEDVPWTMYFEGPYALHGAYWHDSFGFPHSHGCVNMTMTDAQWLFDWVDPPTKANRTGATTKNPGTWVVVHDGHGLTETVQLPKLSDQR
jgi:hypothetical protein